MGMTDKQFNCLIRLILNDIYEILEELRENGNAKDKFEKLAENLQKTLED